MLKLVYVLMGHMAYCMNKLLTYLLILTYLLSYLLTYILNAFIELPASVAQLDARPIGDQEIAGSIPRHVGNIFFIDYEIFTKAISSFR